jgi:hypothetical protein
LDKGTAIEHSVGIETDGEIFQHLSQGVVVSFNGDLVGGGSAVGHDRFLLIEDESEKTVHPLQYTVLPVGLLVVWRTLYPEEVDPPPGFWIR